MNKILLVILLIMVINIPLLIAEQETLGNFKIGECINLRQSCSNCSYSNISQIIAPDSSTVLTEVIMQKIGNDYNYTWCDADQNGEYIIVGFSNVDGIKTSWAYNLFVTPTGVLQESFFENSVLLILLALAMIIMVLAFYMHSFPLGFIAGIMWMLGGVYAMIYGFNNYTDTFTRAVGLVFISIGFIFSVAAGYEWLFDLDDDAEEVEETDEHDYFSKRGDVD